MTKLANTFLRKRKTVYGLLFSFFTVVNSADYVKRVDFFDASNNPLLFIDFEYDNSGNVTRSVYTADSTFLRKTVIVKNADGKSAKEVSLNFNNDTSFVSTFAYSGDNTEMTTKDQFALDQLGGKVNFKGSGDSYEVSQGSTVFNKISYENNKINVTDASGALMYYATIKTGTSSAFSNPILKSGGLISLLSKGNRSFELRFKIQEASVVSCDLYSLSGRNIAKLFNRDYTPGNKKEVISLGKNVGNIANGVYLMSLTIGGKKVLNEKILIQGSKGGF
jgi:hypothetical protein